MNHLISDADLRAEHLVEHGLALNRVEPYCKRITRAHLLALPGLDRGNVLVASHACAMLMLRLVAGIRP